MKDATIKARLISLPKIDLHCHIDGSFSSAFVKKTLSDSRPESELLKMLQAPSSCKSLTEYLTCFDLPIACMQTPDNIINGILDIIQSASLENTQYIELRFAPTCSINSTQNYKDIYDALVKAREAALKTYDIECNFIICAMRHHSLNDNLNMLHAGMDYLGYGICAMDLAGDENIHNNLEFIDLFKEARRLNMPFTIHSGECGSVQNVKIALEAGARRVGHGIALARDYSLMQECKKNRLGLELCPTSNYQTRAVKPGEAYPLQYFLENGLLATVNTDNRTVSNTTMTGEYEFLLDNKLVSEEALSTLFKNSIEISFANDNTKNKLLNDSKHVAYRTH